MKKRHLAKKTVAVTLAALMAAGALTACSSSGGSSDSSSAAEGGSAEEGGSTEAEGGSTEGVTINFRYWADNTEYSQLMQDIVAKFNAENGKGITVVPEESP